MPAARGWRWLVEGFELFRRGPTVWIAFTLILFLAVELASRLPLLGAVLLLFYPVFLGGLMLGCAEVERGRRLQVAHLLAGLRANPVHLTTIGGVYLIGQVLIMWAMVLVGGEQMQLMAAGKIDQTDPQALAEAFGAVTGALLAGTLLSIPLLMAVWFSPLLVVFDATPPLAAMRRSVQACWKNLMPFLVYGLIALGLVGLAMLPFGMAHPHSNPGIWIATPLLLPSVYASYRDIFAAAARAPGAPGDEADVDRR